MKLETIYGPPGTGKTTELVNIAEAELAGANRVAYLSYSKAAATEATSRLAANSNLRTSTIHSLAFQALQLNRQQVVDKFSLKKFGSLIGIPFSGAEANTDEEQQEGDEYMAVVQFARNQMISNGDAYELKGSPGQIDRFVMFTKSYEEWKNKNGLVDFDDMIERAPDRGLPHLPVVILDEAQDCTPLQWVLIDALVSNPHRLTRRMYVAGDDDQAIFEWNGADPHGMVNFADAHKGISRVLTQSYRVPHEVFIYATELTAKITTRVPKEFKPRDASGNVWSCDSVEQFMPELDTKGTDIMFLARDRFQLNDIKLALNHHNVPYSVNGGFSNWTNKYAKAIRAINAANRGEVWDWNDVKPVCKFNADTLKTGMNSDWRKIIDVPPYLQHFYGAVDLDQPIHTRVSTIHSAKGQEADVVVIDQRMSARGEREIYTGDRARDAELRVWYVAYTRAKHELYLCAENPLV